MVGIEGIDFSEVDKIVIKYDQVYTPNKDVCPDRTFPSFISMQEAIGKELEAASNYAYANNLPFQPYTVSHKIKPEFAHEVLDSCVNETSD